MVLRWFRFQYRFSNIYFFYHCNFGYSRTYIFVFYESVQCSNSLKINLSVIKYNKVKVYTIF